MFNHPCSSSFYVLIFFPGKDDFRMAGGGELETTFFLRDAISPNKTDDDAGVRGTRTRRVPFKEDVGGGGGETRAHTLRL